MHAQTVLRGTRFLAALALFAIVSGTALAQSAGSIVVEQAWSRATPGPTPNGAAYLTLHNNGAAPDRLTAVATPAAARAELHTHLMEGDVMKMRRVTAFEVAPGSPTVLQPGGLHIMLFGLKKPLREGGRFPLTLTFEQAGPVSVEVEVRSVGAAAPMHDHGHQGHMGHGS